MGDGDRACPRGSGLSRKFHPVGALSRALRRVIAVDRRAVARTS
jgi:hypothetical protein